MDNALRLRHPLYPRRWQLAPRGVKPKGSGGMRRYCQPENRRSCGAQMSPSERECPTCLAPQGENCPMCGRFTLWKGYRDSVSELCPSCEMARRLQWQKRWRRMPAGAWWQFWKESWVAPQIPERLPPDTLYALVSKDGIGSPYLVQIMSKDGDLNRGQTDTYAGQISGKEQAFDLAYKMYHQLRWRDGG